MTRKFLVTGANGYVGTYVTEALLKRGDEVRAFIRSEHKGNKLRDLGVKDFAYGDLTDNESINRAVAGVDGIFHIAALYREAGLPKDAYFNVNSKGTRRIFEAAEKSGVKRVIHCSTGGVLGDIANPPGNEKTPYNPGDVYQESKVEAEKTALEYYKKGKVRGHVIRPGMIYGPADTRHHKLFKMISRGYFFYVGKGDAWVNFIDVRDLANAFLLAMDNEELNGEIYTIAGLEKVKLFEAVDQIAKNFGVSKPWIHLPVKPTQLAGTICEAICTPLKIRPPIFRRRVDFFTKNRYFDTSKAERELGFKCAKPLNEELKELCNWYRDNGWL